MACIQPASQLARCSHTRSEWTVYAGVFIPLCNAVVIFSDTLPASSPSREREEKPPSLARSRSLSLVYIHNAFLSPALFWRVQTAITTISRCSCKPLEKRKPLIFMTKSSRLAMHARIDRLWALSLWCLGECRRRRWEVRCFAFALPPAPCKMHTWRLALGNSLFLWCSAGSSFRQGIRRARRFYFTSPGRAKLSAAATLCEELCIISA